MDRFRGPVHAAWFDPTSGQYRPIEGSPLGNQGKHDFTPPGSNMARDGDFVLVLEVQ